LTPNVRRSWAPKGQPLVLVHPFNWKKASMAAALCYGVRGGGAQLCFHVTPGNYDTDTLIEVLSFDGSWAARKPPCCGIGCPLIAAARCGPGWRPSGPGRWSSASLPMRRS
jgi:hypothetical protein